MTLQVFVAHTGDTLEVESSFESVDDFKASLAQASRIPSQEQILLTLRGKHVKQTTLFSENQFYLYDRRFFNSNPHSSPLIPPTPLPEPFAAGNPPDSLGNQNNLKSWQNLFKARRDWALSVVHNCRSMSVTAQQHFAAQSIIERGLRVATGNHEHHMKNLEEKYADARSWLEDVSKEQRAVTGSWEQDINRLQAVQIKEGFRPYLAGLDSTPRKEAKRNTPTTLDTFVDYDAVIRAAARSEAVIQEFGDSVRLIGAHVDKVLSEYGELMAAIGQSQSRSLEADQEEPARLMQEIEVIANKVATDYDAVLTYKSEPKSVAAASKTALNHTRSFLPNLRDLALEMSDLLRRSVEQKNAAVSLALEHMQTIAAIESELSGAGKDIDDLNVAPDDIDALGILTSVGNLPYVCGSLLIEAVRRDEWVDKMKRDSATLAEELAGYQEEEQKRRKRWMKSMAEMIKKDGLEGKALGVEINLQGETNSMPHATREDLEAFLNALRELQGMEPILESLEEAVKELDKPTRQQVKRIKAFKNGSVHDAGFGKGSLLLRGDDELRVLREANARLEEDLKGHKSRVRKLEDLLHRQRDSTRLSSIGGFSSQTSQTPERFATPPPASMPSPRPQDDMSRRSSISSRRYSANQGGEEKTLTRRLLKLEAELVAEREERTTLEKELQSRDEHIKEVNFTKNDLMENMEAQQKEFAHERNLLREDLERFKLKVEEMEDTNAKLEDELDRILGSRDHERAGSEDKIRSLISELGQLRKDTAADVRKAEERARKLENEHKAEKDEHKSQLATLHALLDPVDADPSMGGIETLIAGVEQLTIRTKDHVRDLESAIALAKSDNESLKSTNTAQAAEITALASKIHQHESSQHHIQEELATARAKASTLASELDDERKHLADLRSKFAEGETGSEALRLRVTEEESKVEELATELAEVRAHAQSLDEELSRLQSENRDLEAKMAADRTLLEQRSSQAKELAFKIFSQNDRLERLLENVGFAFTYQDDGMVIQRASKTGTSMLSESLNRSLSSPPPIKKNSTDQVDLSLLHWMNAPDPEKESEQYAELVGALDRFKLDTFSEVISKRMKDIEYTAHKWKKEVKNYRDKAHRAQMEAHDKLAIRGFKEGDLALFLPTRNQVARPWAAFNIGAPHFFLREQDSHRLQNKEWLVARITKIEERVVNLAQPVDGGHAASDKASVGGTSDGGLSYDDDNPFQLSDGLKWYLLDAAEEKAGAPTTPVLGKATVGGVSRIDAQGKIDRKKTAEGAATKTLHKSLESRRSSSNSKKSFPHAGSNETLGIDVAEGSNSNNNAGRKRAPSQASSLRPMSVTEAHTPTITTTPPAAAATTAAEEEGAAAAAKRASSVKSAVSAQSSNGNSVPGTPVKASASKAKAPGLWQSLWQLDVNY